jgi:hypothetical protein
MNPLLEPFVFEAVQQYQADLRGAAPMIVASDSRATPTWWRGRWWVESCWHQRSILPSLCPWRLLGAGR